MKKIEELEKIEGNGKVILLNTDNGHWARMSKEWYNRSIQTVEEKEKFGQMLEERFGLLGEGVEKSHSIKKYLLLDDRKMQFELRILHYELGSTC